MSSCSARRPSTTGHDRPRRAILRAAWLWLLIGICGLVIAAPAAGQTGEELAARRFESGLVFVRDGNFREALEDFQAVANLYPESAVADNAILEIARYHLEVSGAVDQAAAAADRIVNNQSYSQGDAAPEAYVVLGRAALARSLTEGDIQDAVSNFQRGLRLYPDSSAVSQTLFYIAEGSRLAGQPAEALAGYRRVLAEHPGDPWAIRARLGAGRMAVLMNDPISAMEEFQRVRDESGDGPEAADALARTTILYRLFVRPPETAYAIEPSADAGGRTTRKVVALAPLPDGNVVVATDRAVSSLRPSPLPASERPRALAVGPDGPVVVNERGVLQRVNGESVRFVVPDRDDARTLNEVDALVATSTGDWLVADRQAETIQRFSRTGIYIGEYADVRAERLAIDPLDRVAVLDNDDGLHVYDAGRQIARLSTRVDNLYRIDNPADVAFDAFGHLYVLDREGVYIFSRDHRFMMRVPASDDAPNAFDRATAMAIDPAGRLYVADERDKIVFVLQ
ncbi:MAG TPA: tetratricopeptide repeat protein [Vicinamibacterales bacterium]|jgi:TolA-binding protein|nr:tetratricopeptide repeat protein [Vicinamibacterales bacterium]HJO38955.1 tetratricopeptide repeat protein [Vicinamibacterales bacterium]